MKKYIALVVCMMLALSAPLANAESTAALGREMAANGQNVFKVTVTGDLTTQNVQDLIISALEHRKWTVKSKADGKIEAELDAVARRNLFGKLTITFDNKVITITDNSVDEKGTPIVIMRWVNYLITDIRNGMNSAPVTAPAKS